MGMVGDGQGWERGRGPDERCAACGACAVPDLPPAHSPALPYPGDKTPLLLDEKKVHGIGERQIARLVKEIFVLPAAEIKKTSPRKAAQLRVASPHWIRHAMASFAAERANDMKEILGLRDLMRHTDLATTLQYVHVADEAKKMISDWLGQQRSINPLKGLVKRRYGPSLSCSRGGMPEPP